MIHFAVVVVVVVVVGLIIIVGSADTLDTIRLKQTASWKDDTLKNSATWDHPSTSRELWFETGVGMVCGAL